MLAQRITLVNEKVNEKRKCVVIKPSHVLRTFGFQTLSDSCTFEPPDALLVQLSKFLTLKLSDFRALEISEAWTFKGLTLGL